MSTKSNKSNHTVHPAAGKPAGKDILIDLSRVEQAYFQQQPDPANPAQQVSFGTSGHRGKSLDGTFTEAHVLATTQAVCDFRAANGINGPLFLGYDTHLLSSLAARGALEVLAANEVTAVIQSNERFGDWRSAPSGFTPTPVVSHAILVHNRKSKDQADGIVITPSHNPPEDGGIKYNPPTGGPAETNVTAWIQKRANELLRGGNKEVRRVPLEQALRARSTHQRDFVSPYVDDLQSAIDIEAVKGSGIRIGVDPLGGSALAYWQEMAARGLNIRVVNTAVDPAFSFMSVDHDGKIRMDCSSRFAMAGLIGMKGEFDVSMANDPDADRHGIVSRSAGLLNPNHFLAIAIDYLLQNRPRWPASAAVGKTMVSSSLIDRVIAGRGRKLFEVPVGFKFFAAGLLEGSLCFGGEESAGASFLRRDGSAWVTDKDGILLGMLAAEIQARTGKDLGDYVQDLMERYGPFYYTRIDSPLKAEDRKRLAGLSPADVKAAALAGNPVSQVLANAPGNNAAFGGIKISTAKGWIAARPSGTEAIYKLYAESFESEEHLAQLLEDGQAVIAGPMAEQKS